MLVLMPSKHVSVCCCQVYSPSPSYPPLQRRSGKLAERFSHSDGALVAALFGYHTAEKAGGSIHVRERQRAPYVNNLMQAGHLAQRRIVAS